MSSNDEAGLGPLISSHGVQPAIIQRAAFIAVLAFLFFLGMMFAFYTMANIIYFLLATAFLLVYIVTMISLVLQKRSVVRIHENGIAYRKFRARWDEIESFRSSPAKNGRVTIEVKAAGGRTATLPETLEDPAGAVRAIRSRLSGLRSDQ